MSEHVPTAADLQHRYDSVARGLVECREMLPRGQKPMWPLFYFCHHGGPRYVQIIVRARLRWRRLRGSPRVWQTKPVGPEEWSAQVRQNPSGPPSQRFYWCTCVGPWDMDEGFSPSFGLAAQAAARALRWRLVVGSSAPCRLDEPKGLEMARGGTWDVWSPF